MANAIDFISAKCGARRSRWLERRDSSPVVSSPINIAAASGPLNNNLAIVMGWNPFDRFVVCRDYFGLLIIIFFDTDQ